MLPGKIRSKTRNPIPIIPISTVRIFESLITLARGFKKLKVAYRMR